MKIAVVNTTSTASRNQDIVTALASVKGTEILNLGNGDNPLSFIHIGYMTGILINTGAVNFVVGGCGTGQGFLNMSLQFPNVICGLITSPLDAFLFSTINNGNCISLPLNQGYGWASEINLEYIFDVLFSGRSFVGGHNVKINDYREGQQQLMEISQSTHFDIITILENTKKEILKTIARENDFISTLKNTPSKMSQRILDVLSD